MRKWAPLLAVCLGTFMLLIDVTIVNVALPDVAGDLHARLSGCSLRRVRRVRIESDSLACYQFDGDEGGVLPLDIEVAARRWTLLLPCETRD